MARDVDVLALVERTLVAFTTLLLRAGVAHASHPPQPLPDAPPVTARTFVTTQPRLLPGAGPRVFARQVVPPQPAAALAGRRTIYLNREGVSLRPGDNDSRTQTSSIVTTPTEIAGWDIDDDTWGETVACVRGIYAPFAVDVTDEDPGDTPHIEAVFGGHPRDVGLPDNVAGVSPFTTDCGVIERSIVFTFTDVLPDEPRTMCEIMAQEIAHSYGLDHEMLPSDPMTYLDYAGERTFQDVDAPCGEYADRRCGIDGNTCRATQNSVALLTRRLGAADGSAGSTESPTTTGGVGVAGGGCSASARGGGLALVPAWALCVALGRRRRRGLSTRPAPRRSPR